MYRNNHSKVRHKHEIVFNCPNDPRNTSENKQ